MAINFKDVPVLGQRYAKSIYGSINQLLGTNLEGWMTATYPAYGNKNGTYLNFKKADEVLLFGNPLRFNWIDNDKFVTKNNPDALEGSTRIIHLFLFDSGYHVYKGKFQFDKKINNIIYLKRMN